jgi:NAD(P)-dependent dehydrogenase (short-subunit alcohol dehydrogenase family)
VLLLKEKNLKYILVTGASGGMGTQTITKLLDIGFRVIALDNKDSLSIPNVSYIKTDITDEGSVLRAFEKVKNITDSIYAIVHFAGIYMLDSLVEISADRFERIMKCNVFGAYMINKIFLPLIQKGGKIVVTTSELAPLDPLPFTGLYGVTKGALDKYAYSLRMELQLLDVSVSVIRAGAVDTGMLSVSTTALDVFCENTNLFSCNAKRFKKIVESVESRKIPAKKIANKVIKILSKKRPKFVYNINRNPLLLILNVMPKRFQFWVIRKILK